MIRLEFSDLELADLHEACEDPSLPEKIKRKLLCLKMHHQKVSNIAIAQILNITPNTVTTYIKEYRDGSLCATLEDRSYRPVSCLSPFLDCLRCFFTACPPRDVSEAMMHINRITGIRLKETQVRKTLHQMGFGWRKTGVIPGKVDPQLQFDFYEKELSPRLEEAGDGERKVFFVDAAHFVLGSFLGMLWCLKRVFIKSGAGRKRYNVLGALDSHSKEVLTVRSEDNINSDTVCQLIEEIRARHPGHPVTLVMDNARYQRCYKVMDYAEEQEVELLFLPAYSPNLNLIERLWKHLKKTCLRNRYFENFTSFRETIDSYLDGLNTSHQDQLDSLLTLNFQFFSKS